MRMRRQGESIKTIAQDVGCHRQTVRMHLKEKRGETLADESRKQVLIVELRNHFQELVDFAAVGLKWRSRPSRSEMLGVKGPEVPMGKYPQMGT